MADDSNHYGFTFDSALVLQDTNGGAAITASQFGKIGGVAQLIDVGDDVFMGCMVIDVAALNVSSGSIYRFVLQGATRGAGSQQDGPVLGGTVQDLGEVAIGNHASKDGSGCTVDDVAGRYFLYFHNVSPDGTHYPILRLYLKEAGGSATITLQGGGVWIGKTPF